jgi:tRNA/tmRNA/rRNA uracil-C5-methylase (TrmA/RlmC/RlmD family)
MKTFKVNLCRTEYQVLTVTVKAKDAEEAEEKAKEMQDDSIEDYKCVEAEEFVQDIEEVEDND